MAADAAATAASETDALEAFDKGYQSGWEDCARTEVEERRKIGADLAAGLRDLTLTHGTIRLEVLSALGPLLEEIVATLLPTMAAEAVVPAVLAELQQIARQNSETRIDLRAAPASCPALERLLEDHPDLPVSLQPEPAFAEGQVSIRFGVEQRDIDLGAAAARMAEAIRQFCAGSAPTPLQKKVA